MPSRSELLPEANAADHAQAAALVVHLLRDLPEAVLWRPGVATWGVCVLSGSVRAVVALDGCLRAVVSIYPGRLRARRFRLDALARLLLGPLQIKRLQEHTLFRCHLPGSSDGHGCVLISDTDLPWLRESIHCAETVCLDWEADARADAGAGDVVTAIAAVVADAAHGGPGADRPLKSDGYDGAADGRAPPPAASPPPGSR
jgi:hypothetical protein